MAIVSAHMILSVLAALLYAGLAWCASSLSASAARRLLLTVAAVHAGALATGFFVPPPAFGFAPAVSISAWLVLVVYLLESRALPQLRARGFLTLVGMVAVLLPLFFPGRALPPEQGAWMGIHIALGMASYALLACAVLHAWLVTRAEAALRQPGSDSLVTGNLPVLTLERLMFGFVWAGWILLSATLLAGLLFDEWLYGSALPFQWTHKVVFAWLAWLTFALLLMGRWRLGWRGRKAVRMVYAGSVFLLLSYIGSRFVLEALLQRAA